MQKTYSELTGRKIQLYFAANYLFDQGQSHPQVVEALSEFEPERDLLVSAADAAMGDRWREIFNESQRLTSEGKNFQEILEIVSPLEPDPEIVDFICNLWYDIQTLYAENTIESRANIMEGIQWTIISLIGTIAMFAFNASLLTKILWSFLFVASLIVWIYGRQQKKIARELKIILEKDYTQYNKLILLGRNTPVCLTESP